MKKVLKKLTNLVRSTSTVDLPNYCGDKEAENNITIFGVDYSISKIFYLGKEFFWVTRTDASDPISKAARNGIVYGPNELATLFPDKGVFLDIGANIGAVSLPLSALGWKGFAIEASSENCDALKRSIGLNQFDIILCQYAVWEKTQKINFVQNGPWGCVQEEDTKFGDSVDAICLDDFEKTPLKDIKKLDLIKMDIEGSEVAGLIGMGNFLERFDFPPIYIEINSLALLNTRRDTQWDLLCQAEKMGYMPYKYEDGFLYKYNKDFFIHEIWGDYLLIHTSKIHKFIDKISSDFKGMTEKEAIPFVIEKLSNYLHNKEDRLMIEWSIVICFALKNYPLLRENQNVLKLMKEIKSNPEYQEVAYALSWFDHK